MKNLTCDVTRRGSFERRTADLVYGNTAQRTMEMPVRGTIDDFKGIAAKVYEISQGALALTNGDPAVAGSVRVVGSMMADEDNATIAVVGCTSNRDPSTVEAIMDVVQGATKEGFFHVNGERVGLAPAISCHDYFLASEHASAAYTAQGFFDMVRLSPIAQATRLSVGKRIGDPEMRASMTVYPSMLSPDCDYTEMLQLVKNAALVAERRKSGKL